MSVTLENLKAVVRKRICRVCPDRDRKKVDGSCGLEEPEGCALFQLFPDVATAILGTSSVQIGDYIEAVRQKVCTVCDEQAADGSCEVRDQVGCALDAYLPWIVEAIEEAAGGTFGPKLELSLSRGPVPLPAVLRRVPSQEEEEEEGE